MSKISKILSLVLFISSTGALAQSGTSDTAPIPVPAEQSPVHGLSVGATGIVGNQGAGGGITAEFMRPHYRIEASGGALSAFDGTGEIRPIGSLGGIYCFRETFGMGLCLGAQNAIQADGNLTQLGASPIGVGYLDSRTGGHLFIGPHYSYILFDNENNTSAHLAGLDVRYDIPLSDSFRILAMFQVGATFGTESNDATAPLEESGAGLFLRGGLGFDWRVADHLRLGVSGSITDAYTGERAVEDTAGERLNYSGRATAMWAF